MTVAIGESQDPIAPGGSVTYTVTASNDGTVAAANVDLSVTLSGTAGAPTAYVISGLTQPDAFCSTDSATTVTCSDITSIAAGADYVVTFTVTAAQVGQIDAAATVSTDTTESNAANNTGGASTTVQVPSADLTVTTSWLPATVYSHSALTVTFKVNNGPLAAADDVTLTATFSGSAFSSLGTLPAECTETSPNAVECDLGTIAASTNAQVTIPAVLSGAGDVVVDVEVTTTSPESNTGNNSDSDTITVLPGCGTTANTIGSYQDGGANFGSATPATFEGIVVGDFQLAQPNGLNPSGFYLQDAGDSNSATSDGIFVQAGTGVLDVAEGDKVRVLGPVSENFGQTRIIPTTVINCGAGGVVTPTSVSLPVANVSDWEKYEGMLVTVTDSASPALTVTEAYRLHYLGEYLVSSGGRLYTSTSVAEPGAAANAVDAANALRRLVIDDGRDGTDIMPACTVPNMECSDPGNPAGPVDAFRIGSTTPSLTGVLGYAFSNFRLHTTVDATFANERPADAPNVGGSLTIASFNVLNFFNGNGAGGGFTTSEQRGPNTIEEYNRMVAKLVIALDKLDADIIGLMEIENDDAGALSAISDLTDALNAHVGSTEYAFIETGKIGTDAIKVALLYRTASVTPQGTFAVDTDPINDRPTLAQTFTEISTGEDITVVVNHFKSKGSCPGSGENTDQGDGQSCWAPKRVQQAQRLLTWLGTDPTGQGDSDILIIGDLNSYAKEDPIDALVAGGYTNLVHLFGGDTAYGYVFGASSGYLDHALASASILPRITGTQVWHINADEPAGRDYNDTVDTPAGNNDFYQPPELYEVNEFRTSDHDPVLIGVSLLPTGTTGSIDSTASITTGDDVTITVVDADLAGTGTVSITAIGSSGDSETLTLTETATLGTFSSTFTVANAAATAGNSALEEESGTIRFDYVDALDAEGDVDTTLSATTTVLTLPPAPESFELIDPADGDILRANTTTFTWTESAGATSYDVLLMYLSNNTRIGEQFTATVDTTACAAGICSLASSTLIPTGLTQGSYSWTVVANAGGEIEASNGPNVFTVVLTEGIELVVNGGLEDGSTGWTFTVGAKRKCGGFGDGSDCAIKLRPGTKAHQRGVMGTILAATNTAAGDVLQVSAAVRTTKAAKQRVVMVVVTYVDPTAGAAGNGKDKFKLFVQQATVGYQTFSANFVLDGKIQNGRVVVANTLPTGALRVDNVSVVLLPIGSAPRTAGESAGSTDGLLPPPAAPENFRGNN